MEYRKITTLWVALMMAIGTLVAQAEEAETKSLEASIALGVTVNEGNTDNNMANLSLGIVHRPSDAQVLRFEADGAYGETDNDKTTENARVALDVQHLFSERAYGAFNTSLATDSIADLDYRSITALGPGYYLIKHDTAEMTVEAGPAYVFEKKAGEEDDYLALRFAERYERVLGGKAKFWQTLEYVPQADDFDVYLLTVEVGIEAPVNERLNLRLSAKNVHDSAPAEGLEKDDLTVIGALVYNLF